MKYHYLPFTEPAASSDTCYAYSSTGNLYDPCAEDSLLAILARTFAGVAAVMILPTVVFGTICNSILAFMLLFKIRRPRHLEVSALFIALSDIGYLLYIGWFYSLQLYAGSWWGKSKRRPIGNTHLKCKVIETLVDFFLTARINIPLATVYYELNSRHHTGSSVDLMLIHLVGFLLTVIIAIPAALLHGLSQHEGAFRCDMDPQAGRFYSEFYAVHVVLFSHGYVQSFCLLALLCLAIMRVRQYRKILSYLKSTRIGQDPIGVLLLKYEYEIKDSIRNLHILLIHNSCVVIFRIFRCTTTLLSQLQTEDDTLTRDTNLRDVNIHRAIWNMATFVELILSSFPYIIWHVNVPQIAIVWRLIFKTLKTRKLPTDRRWTLNPLDYYQQAIINLRGAKIEKMHCTDEIKSMQRWKRKLTRSFRRSRSFAGSSAYFDKS